MKFLALATLLLVTLIGSFAQKYYKDGLLVSTMLYYLGNNEYSFQLVTTDMVTAEYKFIQELLPAGPKEDRSFESFTTYDTASRTYSVVVPQFPSVGRATFWSSTISSGINGAEPIYNSVEITYPVSRSPAPLNVARLEIARLISGPDGRLFTVFTNGEVHSVDIASGEFKFRYSLISDEDQLDVKHPSSTWGHIFEAGSGLLRSVVMSGNEAYVISSNIDGGAVVSSQKMSMPQGQNRLNEFSPETFVNLHSLKMDDTSEPLVLVLLESLPNVGFDQVDFLNLTSGQLDAANPNLMSDNIVLKCDLGINGCDMWRNSALDDVNKKLYFQAHVVDEKHGYGDLYLVEMGFSYSITGRVTWYTNVIGSALWYGYSGMQFVRFVQ